MPECRSLKIGYHSGPVSLSMLATAALDVAGAVAGPARQQRRHQIGDRSADRLVDVDLRGGVFLLLQIAHADHEAGDAVGLVDGQDAVGELDRLVDVAVGERGDEGAVEQFVVLRIGAQRRTVKRRGRSGVALDAGVTGGQIAAGRGQRLEVALGRKLRRSVGGMIRRLRRQRARHRQRGEGKCGKGPAIETNGKHQGLPSSRDFKDRLGCEPSRRHQGKRQCRVWR